MTARPRVAEQVILQPVNLYRPTYGPNPGATLNTGDGTLSGSTAGGQESLRPIQLSSYPTGHMATVSWQRSNVRERDVLSAISTRRADFPVRSEQPTQFWWISAEGLTNGQDESSLGTVLQGSHTPTSGERMSGTGARTAEPSRWSSSSWSSISLERLGEELIQQPLVHSDVGTHTAHGMRDSSSDDDHPDPGRAAMFARHFARTLPVIHLRELSPADEDEHSATGPSASLEVSSSSGSSEIISSGYADSCDSLGVPSASTASIAPTNSISPLNLPPASAGAVPLNAFAPAFLLQHENASLASLLSTASQAEGAMRLVANDDQNWLDMTSSFSSSRERPNSSASSDSMCPYEKRSESSLLSGQIHEEGADVHNEEDASQAGWYPATALAGYNNQITCRANGTYSGYSDADGVERHLVAPQANSMTIRDGVELRDMYRAIQASAVEAVPVGDNFDILAEWMEQSQRLARSRDEPSEDRCQSTTPQPRNRHAVAGVDPRGITNDSDIGSALPAKSTVSFATPEQQQQFGGAGNTEPKSLFSSLLPRLQGSPTKSRLFSTLQRKTSPSINVSLANTHSTKYATARDESLQRGSTIVADEQSQVLKKPPASTAHHVPTYFTMQRGMVRPVTMGCDIPWAPYIAEMPSLEDADKQTRPSANRMSGGSSSAQSRASPNAAAVARGPGAELGKVKRRWYESKDYVPPDAKGSTTKSATVIIGAGTGKCTIALAGPGTQHISTSNAPVGKQSDGSVISLNRFLAETNFPKATPHEAEDDSRTPTPTPSSLGFNRHIERSQTSPPAAKTVPKAIAIPSPAATLDRRGGASVVRTAREVGVERPKPLLLGLGVGRCSGDTSSCKASSFCGPTTASSDRRAPAKLESSSGRRSHPDVARGASMVHFFPMPPPLRSRVGVGVDSPSSHPNHDDDDDNDDDIFLQPRLNEARHGPPLSKRQGSAMSVVLEEEEEEGDDGLEIASMFADSVEAL